jgi:voltage-gated potassium channel
MGRHRGYRWLLAIGVAVLLSFGLPGPWARLSSVGYLALAWTMLRTLAPANGKGLHKQGLYRALGLAAMASGVLWYVTPVELQGTGVPVLALWVSSDTRFWSSGDTKTGPPDGLLMGA